MYNSFPRSMLAFKLNVCFLNENDNNVKVITTGNVKRYLDVCFIFDFNKNLIDASFVSMTTALVLVITTRESIKKIVLQISQEKINVQFYCSIYNLQMNEMG